MELDLGGTAEELVATAAAEAEAEVVIMTDGLVENEIVLVGMKELEVAGITELLLTAPRFNPKYPLRLTSDESAERNSNRYCRLSGICGTRLNKSTESSQ